MNLLGDQVARIECVNNFSSAFVGRLVSTCRFSTLFGAPVELLVFDASLAEAYARIFTIKSSRFYLPAFRFFRAVHHVRWCLIALFQSPNSARSTYCVTKASIRTAASLYVCDFLHPHRLLS
jgi:hypothetical protein